MRSLKLVLLGVLFASAQVWAGCLDAPRLVGVNMSGAEFNSKSLPGVVNKNYVYPLASELAFVAQQGGTAIRLPIRWERVQHEAKGPLDAAEVRYIKQTVQDASAKGLCVIIDIHNYASYYGVSLAGNIDLQNGFVDVWTRLAAEFPDANTTAFDLMNEPSKMPVAEWAALAKRTLAELRRVDAKNLVLVGGGRWSGVHDFFSLQDNVSNATAFADLRDPLNRAVIEVHQYTDKDYSGTKTDCLAPEKFTNMFGKITDWAKANDQRLFLGEFGTPQTENCLQTLDAIFALMDDPVWRGWTYWAMGRWWNNYPLALNAKLEGIAPQWNVLKKYVHYPRSKKSTPNPPVPMKR